MTLILDYSYLCFYNDIIFFKVLFFISIVNLTLSVLAEFMVTFATSVDNDKLAHLFSLTMIRTAHYSVSIFSITTPSET